MNKLGKWIIQFILKTYLVYIGIVIGGIWTGNKYLFNILLVYTIIVILVSLLGDKIMQVQMSKDKKEALKSQAFDVMSHYSSFIFKTIDWSSRMFDLLFPVYTFFFSMGLFCGGIYLFITGYHTIGGLLFISSNIFIIQNNIWRCVKNGTKPVQDDKGVKRAKA